MDQYDNNQYPYYHSNNEPPIQDLKPSKKKRAGLKITALALACALLGGALGGGLVFWGMDRAQEEEKHSTELQVSDREITQVSHKKVDGNTVMTEAEVYEANIHSVVSINTTATAGRNFLGQPVQSASAGSGFVLTKDGYIATNYHVVKNAETVKVTMYDGKEYEARYIGGDESYDIAVIKVEGKEMDPVTLGDSSKLNVGDRVMTVGNPLGELTFSMSGGFVSSAAVKSKFFFAGSLSGLRRSNAGMEGRKNRSEGRPDGQPTLSGKSRQEISGRRVPSCGNRRGCPPGRQGRDPPHPGGFSPPDGPGTPRSQRRGSPP